MISSNSEKIKHSLEGFLKRKIESVSWQPVGGGCINECYEWKTSAGVFFVKVNDAKKYPGMFNSEMKGLQLLNEKVSRLIPKIILQNEDEKDSWLILEWIEKGKAEPAFWRNFAHKLAQLHRVTHEKFGLDHDNYIGSLPQSNKFHNDWISFFALERIEPMLKRAVDQTKIERAFISKFDQLFHRLEKIFPPEKPSLIHGDLWSGNFIIAKNGEPVLVDPAVYYGHREMDLSMMKLFGGFDNSLFQEYEHYFPLEKDFQERCDLFNLYPLLVHTVLFGGHYPFEVIRIIKKFSR